MKNVYSRFKLFLERRSTMLVFPVIAVSLMMMSSVTSFGTTSGLIMTNQELALRPTSGPAWSALKSVADGSLGTPNITDQNNRHAVRTLAVALVAARTKDPSYADKARRAIASAIGTDKPSSNTVLAVGRSLGAYVMAADLVGYRDAAFLKWVKHLRDDQIGTHGRWKSVRATSEDSANNWGTFALTSRIAASAFLGDREDLDRTYQIFTGYTNGSWPFRKTSSYQVAWQCGSRFVAVNDSCMKGGWNLGGAPVDDVSRASYPTPHGGYVTEALQGYAVQAMLLERQGYDAWDAGQQMVKRVADFQLRFGIFNSHQVGYHVSWMLNYYYRGSDYPTEPAGFGRVFGYTDWLFGTVPAKTT